MNMPLLAVSAFLATLGLGLTLGVLVSGKRNQAPQKPRKTSNIVLVVLGVFALAFIIAMIVIFCVKGSVPDTLIQYTLGAGGIEAAALSAIKITKVKCRTKEETE